MNDKEKYDILTKIFWDYHVDKLPLDSIITGDLQSIDKYTFNFIIVRMLERLNWYDLLEILGPEYLKQILIPEIINKLRSKELRAKYEFIGKVLSGEDLSFTGWGDAYYQRLKHTLFSNRWYRTQ
ncbi:MAG TPA: hypothetical protein P5268_06755 [Candidatus Marinimicrobia bacterium]|nr:hypothetical protein [Candidatus Neomarinimicrobiota bacterium]HRU92713.1 hypothetical protein [Candidatus Neomarinimicrobiota bacterium]